MAHNLTETAAFDVNVVVPDPGDGRTAASVIAGFQPVANRTQWLRARTPTNVYDITRAPYNADPTATSDATAAIQAAINDATVSGGVVIVPPGTYKHTGLVWKPNVRFQGVPGASVLLLNHATNHFFTFSASANGELVMYGLDLEGLVTASGDVFHNTSPQAVSVTLQNCWVNVIDNKLTGQLVFSGIAASQFTLIDCTANSARAGLFVQAGGLVIVRGGAYTMLPAAISSLFSAGSLDSKGARFSQVKTGSTPAAFLELQSAGAGFYLRAHGNHFDVDASGAGASGYGIKVVANTYVNASGNTFGTNAAPYLISSVPLRAQSSLELLTEVAVNGGTSTAITVPDSYHSVLIKSTATANVVLTLPTGLFAGQELLLTWFNNDVSARNMTFATTPVTGTAIPNPVTAGDTLSGVFVWEDRDVSGAPSRWVQKGTWGVGLTLV